VIPPFLRTWGWPLLLGAMTTIGLVSALVSERLWASILSWIGLGLPLVLILRFWPLRRWFEAKDGS